jgi:hypothetical protein
MNIPLVLTLSAAALLLAGCAANPAKIAPGTPAASAIGTLGTPTGEYALPGGGRRLEYATGPFGKQTWMLDFDAAGGLVASNQVLNEKRFNQIRAGMPRDELRRELGRPTATSMVGWHQLQIVWSYRYDSPFCQWFQVGIDPQKGTVVDSGYYPDPICDDPQFESFLFRRR